MNHGAGRLTGLLAKRLAAMLGPVVDNEDAELADLLADALVTSHRTNPALTRTATDLALTISADREGLAHLRAAILCELGTSLGHLSRWGKALAAPLPGWIDLRRARS